MRPPGTPSDGPTTEPVAVADPADSPTIASELDAIGRDLVSGAVPDAELLRRIEAFADLFLTPERPATD